MGGRTPAHRSTLRTRESQWREKRLQWTHRKVVRPSLPVPLSTFRSARALKETSDPLASAAAEVAWALTNMTIHPTRSICNRPQGDRDYDLETLTDQPSLGLDEVPLRDRVELPEWLEGVLTLFPPPVPSDAEETDSEFANDRLDLLAYYLRAESGPEAADKLMRLVELLLRFAGELRRHEYLLAYTGFLILIQRQDAIANLSQDEYLRAFARCELPNRDSIEFIHRQMRWKPSFDSASLAKRLVEALAAGSGNFSLIGVMAEDGYKLPYEVVLDTYITLIGHCKDVDENRLRMATRAKEWRNELVALDVTYMDTVHERTVPLDEPEDFLRLEALLCSFVDRSQRSGRGTGTTQATF